MSYAKLFSFLAIFQLSLSEFLSSVLYELPKNYGTSFNSLTSNALTHCVVELISIVDSMQCKELGKRTGRRSSPMEQTPQPKLVPGKRWGKNHGMGNTSLDGLNHLGLRDLGLNHLDCFLGAKTYPERTCSAH